MGEQRNLADRIYTLFIYVTAVILAINGLMVIGLHPSRSNADSPDIWLRRLVLDEKTP